MFSTIIDELGVQVIPWEVLIRNIMFIFWI